MGETIIHERVAAAEQGQNPTVICRMRSGYLVLCDKQTPRGWCILLSVPVVADLNDLNEQQRTAFLSDMAAAGQVLKEVTGAYRINYLILGNTDPLSFTHTFNRGLRTNPSLFGVSCCGPSGSIWNRFAFFDLERDKGLMSAVRRGLVVAGRCI